MAIPATFVDIVRPWSTMPAGLKPKLRWTGQRWHATWGQWIGYGSDPALAYARLYRIASERHGRALPIGPPRNAPLWMV